jgi:hypothetical protein
MRVLIEAKSGEKNEGTIALKDESFVMIKVRKNMIRVFHWDHIKDVKRVSRGEYQPVNIEVFRKTRE